jgi:hypothetical protein
MARRSPEEMLAVLEQQAREDDAFEAPMLALAAMGDAELDDHLRGLGLDPAQLETGALALFIESSPAEASSALPSAVQAVPQQAGKSSFAGETRRRRPLAFAAWLAAGAATATAGGALLYSLTRPAPEQPAPPAPSPSPSEAPSAAPEPTPVATTPADDRRIAAAALDQGRPDECLRLLDRAKLADPAGDAAPDVQALRARANRALRDKPLKPPVP